MAVAPVEVARLGCDLLSHTNFTLYTVSNLKQDRKQEVCNVRSNQDGTCQCWFCGDVDHRPYHDHLDAFCAFRHDRVQQRHGLDYITKFFVSLD